MSGSLLTKVAYVFFTVSKTNYCPNEYPIHLWKQSNAMHYRRIVD